MNTCPLCEHPLHSGLYCEHIPWDGNPNGHSCHCPSEDQDDEMDDE
jgi:hypothetical protein